MFNCRVVLSNLCQSFYDILNFFFFFFFLKTCVQLEEKHCRPVSDVFCIQFSRYQQSIFLKRDIKKQITPCDRATSNKEKKKKIQIG